MGTKDKEKRPKDKNTSGARKVSSPSSSNERITLEPGKRSGQPCIRGLRITVADILDYLASGMSIDEVLADFPSLEREDIQAALRFAANRERAIVTVVK